MMSQPYLDVGVFDRLSDVRAKLKRAKHHLADLTREADAFIRSKPYLIKRNLHPQRPEYVIYWIHSTRPIPSTITTLTGDTLGNLRSALDNLAHALILVNGEQPSAQTYFPVSDDEATYKSQAPRKIKGMAQAAINKIDACRPYKEGNVRLWQMNKFNNIHKHNTSLRVGIFCEGISSTTFHLLSPTNNIRKILKSGDNLTMFHAELDTDQFLEFAFQIGLNEPSIVSECEPIGQTLGAMLRTVTRLVDDFKPLFS
jgi:hypothetical protein